MTDKLTQGELDRLKAAGVEYPWSPRQSLKLLDEIDRYRSFIQDVADGDYTWCPNEDLLEDAWRVLKGLSID